jgi:hypothetical protein
MKPARRRFLIRTLARVSIVCGIVVPAWLILFKWLAFSGFAFIATVIPLLVVAVRLNERVVSRYLLRHSQYWDEFFP